jgi:hypothetical protein
MTSINEESEILKLDVRGRVLVSRERREALLEEFEKSGISGAGFARMVGVKYATFANWVAAKRRRKTEAASGGVVRLLEAEVDGLERKAAGGVCQGGSYATASGLVVELPGGSRLRVESPTQAALAAELIRLVGQNRSAGC